MIAGRPQGHCEALGDATLTLGEMAPPLHDPAPAWATATPAAQARLRSLVAEHFDFIWRSLRRLGLDADGADDGAQKVFMVAARRLSAIEEGSERSFLFGTAMRVASESRRAVARRREVFELDAEAPDPTPRADELLDEQRARETLDEVLGAMPLDLRAVFVLFELEELTAPEIAVMLGLPVGTASSRLRRARDEFHAVAKRLRARRAMRTHMLTSAPKSRGGAR
jgi:RNA polymerase sigma-70 factor (ECF subfamily)